jgi:VanZ family protein
MPASDFPKINVFPYFDKLVHICMYAVLSFLLLWVWNEKKRKNNKIIILCIVFGWGLLMEIIQEVSHMGRSFDLLDVTANVFGFIPGLLVWKLYIFLFENKKLLSTSK